MSVGVLFLLRKQKKEESPLIFSCHLAISRTHRGRLNPSVKVEIETVEGQSIGIILSHVAAVGIKDHLYRSVALIGCRAVKTETPPDLPAIVAASDTLDSPV